MDETEDQVTNTAKKTNRGRKKYKGQRQRG